MSCVTALHSAITMVQAGLVQREGVGERSVSGAERAVPVAVYRNPPRLMHSSHRSHRLAPV